MAAGDPTWETPMPGPPKKDPEKRARRNKPTYRAILPAEGRSGRVPAWPLPDDVVAKAELKTLRDRVKAAKRELEGDVTAKQRRDVTRDLGRLEREVNILDAQIKAWHKLEMSLWRDMWKLPQAVEWERLGWLREVAQYVRWKVRAEMGHLGAGRESRQLADRLGLTPLAMLRLEWKIEDLDVDVGAERARSGDPYAGLYLVDPAAGE